MISLEEMTVPLEGENPAGENLEYDSMYLEMDSLAAGVPASQMGESIIEGKEPDWKALRENCQNLWGKTRDLRVASYLTVAETADGSLEDCVTAFKLIHFMVQDMWDTMYPCLDPDDDNDPTERLNILAMLSPAPGSFNDPIMFISKFRALRLVPMLPYTLRDHLISINEFEAADGLSVNPDLIFGELMRIPLEEVEQQAALARELKETIDAICAVGAEKLASGFYLDMSTLLAEVNKLCKFFNNFLQTTSGGEDAAEEREEGEADVSSSSGGTRGGAVNIANYKPANRADALLLLRKAAEFFQRQEPNSPIPLLVNRALRISEMNFIDLLEDMVPDALSQGRTVLGIKDSE